LFLYLAMIFCSSAAFSYIRIPRDPRCWPIDDKVPTKLGTEKSLNSKGVKILINTSLRCSNQYLNEALNGLPWQLDLWHQWWWEAGNEEAVEVLLKMPDADINARDGRGETKLMSALAARETGLVQLLVQSGGADVNLASNKGTTPATLAVWNKDVDSLRLLVQAGANLDVRDPQIGYTLPMWAVENNDLDCLNVMIDAGVDLTASVPYGTSITTLAKASGNEEILRIVSKYTSLSSS